MSARGCFDSRTFHIYTEHDKNPKCCNEASDYTQRLKFRIVMNEACVNRSRYLTGVSDESEIPHRVVTRYPNYQVRYDAFDVSCNKIKAI
jgi:hypothetical protein